MADLKDLQKKYEQARVLGDKRNMAYFAEQIQALKNRQTAGNSPAENQSNQPDESDADDEDDDGVTDQNVPFAVPSDENNQPTNPPTRGEAEAERLEQLRAEDQARAAERGRATAETPPEEAGVPPQPAVDGVKPPAQSTEATPGDEDSGSQPRTPQVPSPKSENPPPAKSDAADAAKQELEDQAKKGIRDWAAKTFSKEAILAFLEVAWPYIVAIIIILAVIVLVAYELGVFNSGANGKTPVQAISPVGSGGDALKKLSLLSGGNDSTKALAPAAIQSAATALTTLNTAVPKNPALTDPKNQALLDDAIKKINQCQTELTGLNKNAPTDCAAAITAVQAVLMVMNNNAIPPIQGQSPIQAGDFVDLGTLGSPLPDDNFNTNLHVGTPLHPISSKDTNTTGHGTYIYTGQDKGDAVDVYTKPGANVYPAFTGTVVNISDDGTGITKKMVIQNGDYQILYAFVIPDPSIKIGNKITDPTKITDLTKPIAKTNTTGVSVVHIEFEYCGIPLVTTFPDQLDHDGKNGVTPKHTTWGAYYWDHLKTVLKLP